MASVAYRAKAEERYQANALGESGFEFQRTYTVGGLGVEPSEKNSCREARNVEWRTSVPNVVYLKLLYATPVTIKIALRLPGGTNR